MQEKLGVMLCGHGSRDEDAVKEFAVLAQHLKKRLLHYSVEFGYLEFATPIIRTGLDKLKAAGVTRVLAVPGMLFAAGHAKNDIPSVLNTYAAANNLKIEDDVAAQKSRALGVGRAHVQRRGRREMRFHDPRLP